VDRLGWILDGLNGAADWGSDAADVLAPEFPPWTGEVLTIDAVQSLARNLPQPMADPVVPVVHDGSRVP